MNYVDKLKDIKNKLLKFKNNLDFVPRQTLSVKIDDKQYYVSLICNNSFEVKLVLLDEFDNVIENIFEFESDKVNMVKGNGKLYLFTEGKCYIFDINNLKSKPEEIYLGNLNIQSVCSNQNYIYAYSIENDCIIQYDYNLIPINEYKNLHSKEKSRLSVNLTCNEDTFISLPIMTRDQYDFIRCKILGYIGINDPESNRLINSISYNSKEEILFISLHNIIIMLGKDQISYRYFINDIVSVHYDSDIDKLIINIAGTDSKGNLKGRIIKLSKDEIKRSFIKIDNLEYNNEKLDKYLK